MKSDDCLYVGIDFSKDRNDFALLPAEGPPIVKHKAFRNSYTGYRDAKEWLLKSLSEHNLSQIKIAGESTSYYWLPLFSQFLTDQDWKPYHLDAYLINATLVHWFKKSKSPNSKTDLIDPAEIGDYLRERNPGDLVLFLPNGSLYGFIPACECILSTAGPERRICSISTSSCSTHPIPVKNLLPII